MLPNFDQTIVSSENDDYSFKVVAEGDRKKFICQHRGCGKVFKYKSEVERHVTIHSSLRPFKCQYDNCLKSFKRSDALDNHIRCSHTKETLFTCTSPDCGMKFTSHGSFRYHMLKHNKQVPEEALTQNESSLSESSKQVKLNPPLETIDYYTQSTKKIEHKLQPEQNLGQEFFAPTVPKYANNVQWEVVNEDTEGVTEIKKTDEADSVNKIEEENKILKQKLMTSERIIKNMQKQMNDLLSNLFGGQPKIELKPANLTSRGLTENVETPSLSIMNFDEEMNFFVEESIDEKQSSLMNNFSPSRDMFEFKKINKD